MASSSDDAIRARWADVVDQFDDVAPIYAELASNIAVHRSESAPYYSWMAATIRPYLGRRALELGAGPGFLSSHLAYFDLYIATETWPPFLNELRTVALNRSRMQVEALDASELPKHRDRFRSLQLESIFSTNMLEHIKDDVGTLRAMADAVGPGSRVVNLVPSFRALYGTVDRSIGHFRRYEKEELRQKYEAAGLSVESIQYFNLPGYLAWALVTRVLKQPKVGNNQFHWFNKMVPIFRTIDKVLPTFAGSSLICVGRVTAAR